MELPKNITQIGESDAYCKVYVEDYVISYVKQMNRMAENREMSVALYGTRKEEEGLTYLFFYGACKLDCLLRDVRHLSQAQLQETERLRKRYFPEYQFLGYRLLNGDMVEGFYVCEQGNCRYMKGYACFYEKNDSMLAYMLDSRNEEAVPEEVNQEKFEQVRKNQERRREDYEASNTAFGRKGAENDRRKAESAEYGRRKTTAPSGEQRSRSCEVRFTERQQPEGAAGVSGSLKWMRASVFVMFGVLCILGLSALSGEGELQDIQAAARNLIAEFTEQRLPDQEETEVQEELNQEALAEAPGAEGAAFSGDTLVAEDKLTEAIREENMPSQTQPSDSVPQTPGEGEGQAASEAETDEGEQEPSDEVPQEETKGEEMQTAGEGTEEAEERQDVQEPAEQASAPTAYIIKKGDTLIGISLRVYGSEEQVKQICDLNQIADPNDIYFGQKILLP